MTVRFAVPCSCCIPFFGVKYTYNTLKSSLSYPNSTRPEVLRELSVALSSLSIVVRCCCVL